MDSVEKEVVLSDRTKVTIRHMRPSETLTADEYIGASISLGVAFKTYAVCSIRAINGVPVFPLKDRIQFERTIDALDLFELDKLVTEYRLMVTLPVDALKNESNAPSEGSLPPQ